MDVNNRLLNVSVIVAASPIRAAAGAGLLRPRGLALRLRVWLLLQPARRRRRPHRRLAVLSRAGKTTTVVDFNYALGTESLPYGHFWSMESMICTSTIWM